MLHYLFAFAPFFVCLFWVFLLFSSPTSDKGQNRRVLGLFMIAMALLYLAIAVYYLADDLSYRYVDDLYVLTSLLIFPLYYLFMVNLTKECICQWKYVWHIAPAFFFFGLYASISLLLTDTEYEAYLLNFLHIQSPNPLFLSDKGALLAFVFLAIRVYYLIQIFFYVCLSLQLSKLWKQRISESLSETIGRDIRSAEVLSVYAISFATIGYLFDTFGQYFVSDKSLILLVPGVFLAALYFKLGKIGYEQSFTIYDLEKIEETAESSDEELTKQHSSELRQRLEALMQEQQLFLIPDLRISSVCEALHTNRTYLSQVLNEELKENFNSFINKYRVDYAIALLNDTHWANYSLDKYAELSGFGSTVSMIRAFKQHTGKTPSEFK